MTETILLEVSIVGNLKSNIGSEYAEILEVNKRKEKREGSGVERAEWGGGILYIWKNIIKSNLHLKKWQNMPAFQPDISGKARSSLPQHR